MDMNSTLKTVLSGLGANVYAIERPADSPLPTLVYRTISDEIQDKNHDGAGQLHYARVQITHVATTPSGLFSLVSQVQGRMEANKTNFSASISTTVHLENKEADNIYSTTKDYFVQYKSGG